MKKLICQSPGHFLYREEDIPVRPQGYALLKILRVGICGTDIHAFDGTQPYFSYPRVLGHEVAGEVIDIDSGHSCRVGETVTFIPYISCAHCIACRTGKPNCCVHMQVCGVHIDGAMAEYFLVPDQMLVHGEDLSADALALVEPLAIGAHGVQRANVAPGEHVLIIGAGPIGLAAIEFARIAGGILSVMDVNQHRLLFCKEQMHVAHTINALSGNITEQLQHITDGAMPSVVIDATGNQKAINNGFHYMAHGARYTLIGLQSGDITFSHPEFHKREAALLSSRNATRENFMQVINAIQQKIIVPEKYITHRIPFNDLKDSFDSLTAPGNHIIKAMVTF